LEEILIVTVDGTAIRDDQPRLALASGAAATLSVISRRRWYVPQMDKVKVSDVHAEFHCGGANKIRQSA
jgi:hypothetical protein